MHLADGENLTNSQPTQFENFLFITIYEQEKEDQVLDFDKRKRMVSFTNNMGIWLFFWLNYQLNCLDVTVDMITVFSDKQTLICLT